MRVHDPSYNRKPDACPALLSHERVLGTVELVENQGDIPFWDPEARIVHRNCDGSMKGHDGRGDPPTCRGVLHRVVQHVHEYLVELLRVAHQGPRDLSLSQRDLHSLSVRNRTHFVNGPADRGIQVYLLPAYLESACVETRKAQKLLNEGGKALVVIPDDREEALQVGVLLAFQQRGK